MQCTLYPDRSDGSERGKWFERTRASNTQELFERVQARNSEQHGMDNDFRDFFFGCSSSTYSTYYKYTQRPWTLGVVKSCCWLRRNLASESDAEGRIDLGDSIGTCGWDSMIFNSMYVAMNQCSPCHNHWNFLPSQK